MTRHLPRLLTLGALLSPVTVYALGLGEIRPHSALNQPFDAEIELISPTADELSGLKVGLAGVDMYQRYGLDRPVFLSNFQFSVQRTRDGRASIKVTSNRSVTEPFVTLLIEASWARGRLLREYTVLLDPPVFMPSQPEAQAAPVTTPQAGAQTGRIERPVAQEQPAEQPPAQAAPLPTPAEPVQEPTREPAASSTSATPIAGEYTVERNDTLWRIASRVTPSTSRREINRTMIALFRANPAAFNGNINRLRSGSVLRIPELADIETISTSDATAEVQRQAAEWSGAQPPSQVAQEEANRLRLVTPVETPAAPTPAPATPQQPAAKPSSTAATAAVTPQDNRVALPSPGLAETQQSAANTPVEAAPQQEQPAQPTPAEATPPAAEQPAQTKPVARPRVQPPQETGPSLLDRIGEFWWAFVVAGGAVILAFLLIFIRRRRAESAAAIDSMAGLDLEPRTTRPAPALAPVTKARDRDSFLVEDSEDDSFGEQPEPAPAPTARRAEPPKPRLEPVAAAATVAAPLAAASPRSDETMSSETQVRFDQQDALAEADFHMAYGLYDQAADLVKIAIDREPGRRDLKLKLLEIYFVWGNKDLFLETARELHSTRAQAAPGEWDKVLIMGKQIAADDAMFKGEAAAAHVDLVDVNLEGGENRVDVDLFAEPEADKPAGLDLEFTSGEHVPPPDAAASSDLDFLLDEPKRGADEEPTREIDPLSRTQETPTIETPQFDRSAQTMRERAIREKADRALSKTEQTAELSLDDLGLDVEALEQSGSLEDTTSLEKDATAEAVPPLRDDEMTQLAPSISSFDRTMQAPRENFDIESTGTIYIDQVDLAGGDTVEQPRVENESTAEMKRPASLSKELDLDLDHLSGLGSEPETIKQVRGGDREADNFSSDVFADHTAEVPRVDLDVGEPLSAEDTDVTHRQTMAGGVGLSELEPVTMSEVGTKLDLARAYMDMGDPDGARSILEEVLSEGNASQKQEAQRLMESIR
ncbi:MAG TPA: FimV/HubP family polar landmark protein [Steroidobacteraceae bacterium]|nr:FimV/HubP family polar landmark protein [Steroidobacteraceae bacterium]